jgi:hypothetical protein
LQWQKVEGADTYRLYYSEDNGATWKECDLDGHTFEEATVTEEVVKVSIECGTDGLKLFKVGACNRAGEAIQTDRGAWIDATQREERPTEPASLAAE